jgi:hypothetical protein
VTPFWKSLLYLLYGLVVVSIPFALGRWSKGTRYCEPCERRMAAANRARSNGEHVARLRQRAISPDEVRAQAAADRQNRMYLLEESNTLDARLRNLGVTW